MPDFLSGTDNELMAYETGAGSVRTVFGHGYQRLCQCTAEGKTFFQSDIYGSPLFAADGQGTVRQYAERGIWGGLKAGTEIPAGLEENLRFTSYRHDPVLGKHFAHARFYDDANGRMLALDPVRRDLNGYRYCDDDPVNYADPTGEVLNIIGGALLGGVFGGAGGLISSAVSQKLNGGEVDWKKAWGAAANGAITGAVQGGLVASGAGIPVALASNFLAGAAGSAAEQYISEGKVDARKSITSGLTNAVSNAIYGTRPLDSVKGAFLRGAGAGAATAGINYISDLIGQNPGWGGPDAGFLTGMAGKLVSPYGEVVRNPRRGCGSASPFVKILGYDSAKGFQYCLPRIDGFREQKKKFDFGEFLGATALGGVVGGFTSAGFYGAGKGIERLKDSFWSSKGKTRAEILVHNKAKGKAYAQKKFDKFKSKYSFAEKEVTIKTSSGTRTRVDAIGLDVKGNVIIHEFKSSKTAPLTKNQKVAFPEILHSGGSVVGKGKGVFGNNYQIPAGVKVKIIRPILF